MLNADLNSIQATRAVPNPYRDLWLCSPTTIKILRRWAISLLRTTDFLDTFPMKCLIALSNSKQTSLNPIRLTCKASIYIVSLVYKNALRSRSMKQFRVLKCQTSAVKMSNSPTPLLVINYWLPSRLLRVCKPLLFSLKSIASSVSERCCKCIRWRFVAINE